MMDTPHSLIVNADLIEIEIFHPDFEHIFSGYFKLD